MAKKSKKKPTQSRQVSGTKKDVIRALLVGGPQAVIDDPILMWRLVFEAGTPKKTTPALDRLNRQLDTLTGDIEAIGAVIDALDWDESFAFPGAAFLCDSTSVDLGPVYPLSPFFTSDSSASERISELFKLVEIAGGRGDTIAFMFGLGMRGSPIFLVGATKSGEMSVRLYVEGRWLRAVDPVLAFDKIDFTCAIAAERNNAGFEFEALDSILDVTYELCPDLKDSSEEEKLALSKRFYPAVLAAQANHTDTIFLLIATMRAAMQDARELRSAMKATVTVEKERNKLDVEKKRLEGLLAISNKRAVGLARSLGELKLQASRTPVASPQPTSRQLSVQQRMASFFH